MEEEDKNKIKRKPVPKPRNPNRVIPVICLSKQDGETENISDDVFSEASIEINQNLENERKLKLFRNKSYEVALEDESLDMSIPGSQSGYTEDEYLPMGKSIIASASGGSEKPKPVPRPRPCKSQSVDDLKTEGSPGRYSVQKSPTVDSSLSSEVTVNNNKLLPSRHAPPPPVKVKPVSDSDAIPSKKLEEKVNEKELRPKSTTWYDNKPITSGDSVDTDTASAESDKQNVYRHHDEEIKLPTRKEKHSFLFGSQIFETIKSWTGGSASKESKISKHEKSDEQRDRSSKFYFNVADKNLDKPLNVDTHGDKSAQTPPIPSPRSKVSTEEPFSPVTSPRPPSLASTPLPTVSQDPENEEAPPLPPPRSKRKSKLDSSRDSFSEGDMLSFKSENLDLMAEIKETLEDLNNTEDSMVENDTQLAAGQSVSEGDKSSEGQDSVDKISAKKSSEGQDSVDRISAKKSSEGQDNVDKISAKISISNQSKSMKNIVASPVVKDTFNSQETKPVLDTTDYSQSQSKQFEDQLLSQSKQFDDLDVIIPPAGIVKTENNSLLNPQIDKHANCESAPISPAPGIPSCIKSDKIQGDISVPSHKQPRNRASDLDIVVYEDNDSSSTDSEYYDGYVEPEGLGMDKFDVSSLHVNNKLDVRDDCLEPPAPALPPRARSASPASLKSHKLPPQSLNLISPEMKCNNYQSNDQGTDSKQINSNDLTGDLLPDVLHEINKSLNNDIPFIDSFDKSLELNSYSSDCEQNNSGKESNSSIAMKIFESSSTLHDSDSSTSTLTSSMSKTYFACQNNESPLLPSDSNTQIIASNKGSNETFTNKIPSTVDNSECDNVSLTLNSDFRTETSGDGNKNMNHPCIFSESQNVFVDKNKTDTLNNSETETMNNKNESQSESDASEATTPTDSVNILVERDSSTYVSADSVCNMNSLDFVIPIAEKGDNCESTLKPNMMLSMLPICESLESNSPTSSEENVYEVPDDTYSTLAFDRYSDTNASFSSTTSSELGTSSPTRIILRREKNMARVRGDSSGSDTNSRPASWASFGSGGSDIPWLSATDYRLSGSHSLDVLHNSAMLSDLSISSARSSLSSLGQSDEEGEHKDEEEKQEEKRKKKLFYVAREMMTSERSFVDILKLLNEDFRNVIAKSSAAIKAPVVPPVVLSQVLRHLPELQKFNESLLHDLTERVNNWEKNPKVADIFVKKGPFLKLYTAYIMDFENKNAIFEDARKKYFEFDKCTTYFEASARCHKLGLQHFMLKPVQRLPQYRLLLHDYQKYLTKDSPDYEDAIVALKIVSEVAEHANQSMKYGENLNKLLQIQNRLVGRYEVIRPGRFLIKEGELMKLSRKVMQPRYFFLLNDVLLYTTPYTATYSSKQFRLNNALPLLGMKVDVPNKEGYQNEFSIISTQRSFTVCTRTPEEKDDWLKVLREAIDDNSDKRKSFVFTTMQAQGLPIPPEKTRGKSTKTFKLGSQHPIWIPDSRVSMCMLCTGEFTLAFRRHHCRSCGKVVCAFCSDYKAPLHYLGNKPGRVCKDCFGKLRRAVRGSLSGDDKTVNQTKEILGQFTKSSHGIKSKLLKITESQMHRVSQLRETLGMSSWTKPQALKEVSATDPYAVTSGYLKLFKDKKWIKRWYVLKGKVLYGFKGSEDTAASDSTVLLGYELRPFLSDRNTIKNFNGVAPQMIFELLHKGLPTIIFSTDNPEARDKWMKLIREATIT